MKTLLYRIKDQVDIFNENVDVFMKKGNKAAGARARKATNDLTKLLKEFRKKSVDAGK